MKYICSKKLGILPCSGFGIQPSFEFGWYRKNSGVFITKKRRINNIGIKKVFGIRNKNIKNAI